MLRASGNMAFHTYWSISLFFAHFSGCNMASSRKPLYKKSQTVDTAVPRGWACGSQKPELDLLEQLCAGSAQKKKDASVGKVEDNECGEKGKTVPGKCRAGLLTWSCFYFAWILRRRNPKTSCSLTTNHCRHLETADSLKKPHPSNTKGGWLWWFPTQERLIALMARTMTKKTQTVCFWEDTHTHTHTHTPIEMHNRQKVAGRGSKRQFIWNNVSSWVCSAYVVDAFFFTLLIEKQNLTLRNREGKQMMSTASVEGKNFRQKSLSQQQQTRASFILQSLASFVPLIFCKKQKHK